MDRKTVNEISLVETKKGNYTLKVKTEDDSIKTLHSLYDPESEARNIVDAFEFSGMGVLVILGLGLGYHVVELVRRFPDAEFLVVEAYPVIQELAREHGPEIGGKVEIITGLPPEEALKKVTALQMKDGIAPISVFAFAPAVSIFPDYYGPILSSLKKVMSVRLWDRLKYPKFVRDTLNVALIDSGYFLVAEAEKALLSLNHKVLRIPVGKNDQGEAIVSRIIGAILDTKPDFILTINHLGFDEDGVLTSFFRSIEMPVGSWYVDSPHIILSGGDRNISPYVSMFLWDKEYIETIEDMGFESVSHLPLASDEKVFKPMINKGQGTGGRGQGIKARMTGYSCDVGFVGNSLVDETRKKMEKIPYELHPLVEKAAAWLSDKRMSFNDLMSERGEEDMTRYKGLSAKQRLDVESAVLWKATLLYRLSCVEKLEGLDSRIYGDKGWDELLEARIDLRPPLNYYKDLPIFYNACNINFNATHLQMGEAVNQRVFDVPACGAFLLTDHQKGLEELFDTGKEIITYKHKDEIPGLVRFYLDNPHEREAVAKRARERVLKEHTYGHRLNSLIGAMKQRYK